MGKKVSGAQKRKKRKEKEKLALEMERLKLGPTQDMDRDWCCIIRIFLYRM